MQLLKRLFGTKNQRDIKRLKPLVDRINQLDASYRSLSETELRAKTLEFKERLAKGAAVDDLLCEAFAVVKQACRRLAGTRIQVCGHELIWEMVPYDVQLIGGIVLHQGKIAEMATGEGKTLVATMPLYLNALTGRNVHLVTVNDYLARRDAEWMGTVYRYLGLTVGCIQNAMRHDERSQQYGCDITYGTNSEFGFDYLRDNGMAYSPEGMVQRGYSFAIVDEVDSILIDEARTPLIISGPAPVSSHQYFELKPRVQQLVNKQHNLCNRLIREVREHLDRKETEAAQFKLYQVHQGMPKHKQLLHLLEEPDIRKLQEQVDNMMLTDMRKEQARELRESLYFTIDERGRDATLTDMGCAALDPTNPDSYVMPDILTATAELDADTSLTESDRAKKRLEIQAHYSTASERIHNVDQLIRAYCLYEKDVEYVVQENQVLIVDEFTGRILPGRRWSDGLHQAVEAKEGVKIERETQTLATITIQNYFRMYDKLAGMTGTAETEASEFHEIYKLDVVVIPTNRPVRRIDNNDQVYKTQREKYKAVVDEVVGCHQRGQPVLVGTVSVETSELISRMLKRAGVVHTVLNAKNHAQEAEIVMRAGQPGAVTIATNMAGRGTDIKLGEGVVHLDRSVITSGLGLQDRLNGRTLREILEATPCGLHVLGSERHESRRIDRQLRGRCARQGDPGSSRFFVSLEDDLMRLFGSDRIAGIMSRLGMEEGVPLEHRWLNRSIETAQRRVEQQNFSIRKRTLEYDDVMNKQREVIYTFRGEIVRAEKLRERVLDIFDDLILTQAEGLLAGTDEDGVRAFVAWVQQTFPVALRVEDIMPVAGDIEQATSRVLDRVRDAYALKMADAGEQSATVLERQIILQSIDTHWQEYLRAMDALRSGVGLRAYGQRDPLVEYRREASNMFGELMGQIKQDIGTGLFRVSFNARSFGDFISSLPQTLVHDQIPVFGAGRMAAGAGTGSGDQPEGPLDDVFRKATQASAATMNVQREAPKVGRNDPCPCGSGKKYKKCCGQ